MGKSTNTGLVASSYRPEENRLDISTQQAIAEWRALTKKRNRIWNAGQNISAEDDFRISQLFALLNPYNREK